MAEEKSVLFDAAEAIVGGLRVGVVRDLEAVFVFGSCVMSRNNRWGVKHALANLGHRVLSRVTCT